MQAGVITWSSAVRYLGKSAVRWRLRSGRWRRVSTGVLVMQSGPLTETQRLWAAILAAGDRAVLGGLTAARLDGLAGFEDPRIYLLIPAPRQVRKALPGVVAHRSGLLEARDVHPVRSPPRTRISRSLVDAAGWAATDRLARAILAAGVQQRLVRPGDLSVVVERCSRVRRRGLSVRRWRMSKAVPRRCPSLTSATWSGASGCPSPTDSSSGWTSRGAGGWMRCGSGHASWLRSTGAGTWTLAPGGRTCSGATSCKSMVIRVLRFPAFAVRDYPRAVAAQIARALGQAGLDVGRAAI